ncbi:phage antitermination protein [Escherichia coli]|nr:phage antitermination protein [Escherichia coli]
MPAAQRVKSSALVAMGKKFIESVVFTNKVQYPDGKPPVWAKCTKGVYPSYWEEWKKVREVVKVACPECGGKGEVFHRL